jgi:hypothetical protein
MLMRPLLLRLLSGLLLLAAGVGTAASLEFAVTAGPEFRAGLLLEEVPLDAGSGSASLGLAWSDGLAASLYLRHTTAFGPVGNLVVELRVAGSSAGLYSSALVARGVAGNVAARLRLSSRNDDSLLSAGPAASVFPPQPRVKEPAHGLELGATWRVSPSLLFSADAGLQRATSGTAWSLAADVRLPRQADGHDLILGLDGYLLAANGQDEGFAALRVGRQFNRRRAAPWTASLLFGAGPGHAGPGFRLAGTEMVSGAELQVPAALEFYRPDRAPLQLQLQLRQPLAAGSLTTRLAFDWSPGEPALLLAAGYSLPVQLR